jgi:3',5'-cyclic-AMP phosphodiesterase
MRHLRKGIVKLVFCVCLFWACDNPFSYSPFEARVAEELQNTTAKNLQRIALLDTSASQPFKIALIADVHYHFDNLRDALTDINQRDSAAFIIVAGDITENGLQKEFELFHQIMASAGKPYLTVIGNHDYLSNGGEVYQQMFGPFNYSFTFRKVKFVMWDDVLWESKKAPDWKWLETSLGEPAVKEAGGAYRHVIPFSHIPPTDGQLEAKAQLFHQLLRDNNVNISIHGHKHAYSKAEYFGDGIRYVTIGSPQKRSYALLTITPYEIAVEKIEY